MTLLGLQKRHLYFFKTPIAIFLDYFIISYVFLNLFKTTRYKLFKVKLTGILLERNLWRENSNLKPQNLSRCLLDVLFSPIFFIVYYCIPLKRCFEITHLIFFFKFCSKNEKIFVMTDVGFRFVWQI